MVLTIVSAKVLHRIEHVMRIRRPQGPKPEAREKSAPPTPSPPANVGKSAKPGESSTADSPTPPPVRRRGKIGAVGFQQDAVERGRVEDGAQVI